MYSVHRFPQWIYRRASPVLIDLWTEDSEMTSSTQTHNNFTLAEMFMVMMLMDGGFFFGVFETVVW